MASDRNKGRKAFSDIQRGLDVSSLSFVVMAQSEMIDDVTILEHTDIFIEWSSNWTGKVGTIVRDPDDERLYRKINTNFDTPYPQSKPNVDKSQWKLIGDPGEEWPEWSQPLGAHDAYEAGAKVTWKDKRWINSYGNGNSWEPGVYGWTEAT